MQLRPDGRRRAPATRIIGALVLIAAIGCPGVAAAAPTQKRHRGHLTSVTINVVSNRADLISGGDALVAVTLPPRAAHRRVRIALGRVDVRRQFSLRAGRVLEGVVSGLRVGRNLLRVRLPDGTGAQITITNHSIGGPVFSGPQVKPWTCQAGAVNARCDAPPRYSYVYESSHPTRLGFAPYDPAHPPADVASTTTDQGIKIPFIVRVETGYQDRDQYQIASLFQPGVPWSWSRPQPQWNHKLLITHGASCNVDYGAGTAPSVTSYNPANLLGLPLTLPAGGPLGDSAHYALAHGFAVMSTALDNSGHNCNVVTQAESLVMAKEHLVETYGTLRYTIGAGCSGGSLAQQWIANAYPGVYQGILPTCSFPDTWSSATQVLDYHLLLAYFQHPSHWGPGVVWLPTQWAPVEGNLLPLDAIASDAGFFGAIIPTHPCGGITGQQRYQPQTNPAGVRCSISDFAINVFGPRPKSVWSANERKLGHGFADVPIDNVGVQYGVGLLRSGTISPAQFVDLNAAIGGLDIDIKPTAQRIAANPTGLANAYRSGMINETNNLGRTAIIDCRGPDPGAAHDSYRAFAVRARLDRERGTHANQVIWEGPAPIIGDTDCTVQSLIAMDRWLAAVTRDHGTRSWPAKVIADRPADVQDECFSGTGQKLSNGQCPGGVVPVYGTPRTIAGDPITTDANKCQRKPLRRADYPVQFTESQWAELQRTFASGVCDYGRPGVEQQPTVPWMTYQNSAGGVIYGGRPLGPPPRSRTFG